MKSVLEQIQTLTISDEIPELGKVSKIEAHDDTIEITLGFHNPDISAEIHQQLEAITPNFTLKSQVEAKKTQDNVNAIKGVKNIIAIASGKGGVGKSSVSANIAIALSQLGAKVGLLDADIYGPSQPTMLGNHERPQSHDGKIMEPIRAHGIEMNSIGLLVEEGNAMVWRGPMVTSALQQLINETNWGDLDYLVIDLPPGTGDIQLTLAQKIPVTGAVTVTTPQDISLIDATRAINMFTKVGIDNLGIIENMSGHICSNCGHHEAIFGQGGGEHLAKEYAIQLLGQIPLDLKIRQSLDAGNPIVMEDPHCEISRRFHRIASKIVIQIAKKERSYRAAFGKISVEGL